MKKLFSLFAITVFAVSTFAQTNLLTNGDFETWSNDLPTHWKSACTASNANLSQSSDAHSGSYSVSVAGYASANKRLAYEEMELEAGSYTFTYYAKGTEDAKTQTKGGYVPVAEDGSVGSYMYGATYYDVTKDDWTKVTYEFTLTSKTRLCILVMNAKTTEGKATAQSLLVDDASLVKAAAPATIDTIGVNDAIQRIKEGELGACYVKGKVTKIDASGINSYGNLNCWMVDENNPDVEMEGYRMTGKDDVKYTSPMEVEYMVGDVVMFYAKALKLYSNNSTSTYELDGGYFVQNITNPISDHVVLTATTVAVTPNTFEGYVAVELSGSNFEFYGEPDMVTPKGLVGVYELTSDDELTYNGSAKSISSGTLEIDYVSETASKVPTYKYTLIIVDKNGVKYTLESELVTSGIYFEEDNNNIDVAMALAIAKALPTNGISAREYNIYGYVAKDKEAWKSNSQSFYMTDEANASMGDFLVYKGYTTQSIPAHTYVAVKGTKLQNYQGNTPETTAGATVEMNPTTPILRHGAPVEYDTIKCTVAEALAAVASLADGATTDVVYDITAFVVKAYDPSESGEQSFYFADSAEETDHTKELMSQFSVPSYPVVEGDQVRCIGKITHPAGKTYFAIRNGIVENLTSSAFENFLAPSYEKAQKVVENGQVLIIRNGQVYNLQGVQL